MTSRLFLSNRSYPVALPRVMRIALGTAAAILLAALPAGATLTLVGVHCPPSLYLAQGTTFTHFNAMNPADVGGQVDCNDVICSATLETDGMPISTGWDPSRPIVEATITFHAVREDGLTEYTADAVTDLHGWASARFDDLPVTGRYHHAGCADTPSATWECYTFYASYPGVDLVQVQGDCVERLSSGLA